MRSLRKIVVVACGVAAIGVASTATASALTGPVQPERETAFSVLSAPVTPETRPLTPEVADDLGVQASRAQHVGTADAVSYYFGPSAGGGDLCLIARVDNDTTAGTCNRAESAAQEGLWLRFSDLRLGSDKERLVVAKPTQLPASAQFDGRISDATESQQLFTAVVPAGEQVTVTLTGANRAPVEVDTAGWPAN